MARRNAARPRKIASDPVYGEVMVSKLINRSMYDGKKSVAQKQVYEAFEKIKATTNEDPVKIFLQALENVKPTMEVRPRRIGGAAYQVPVQVRGARRDSLGIRWLVEAARGRSNSEFHTFGDKLAAELLAAINNEGGAVKKRQDVEKSADANRAFAHFKW